jgi:DNA recombination protein RmuC
MFPMFPLMITGFVCALISGGCVYIWLQRRIQQLPLLEAERNTLLERLQTNELALQHVKNQEQATQARLYELQQTHAGIVASFDALKESSQKQEAHWKALWETQLQQFLQKELEANYHRMNSLNQAGDEERHEKFQGLVQPVKEMLNEYQTKLQAMDEAYKQQVYLIKNKVDALTLAKEELVSVLKHNKGAGDWGELQLLRLLELSGLKQDVHYTFQPTIAPGKRPDVKIFLPQERYVIVDSKAMQFSTKPLYSFEQVEAATPAILDDEPPINDVEQGKQLVRSIKTAVDDLHKKNYTQGAVNETPNFVVLFLPQESMLANALEADPSLWETAWQKQVLLSSPLTLIALLRMIHVGWNQQKLTENMLAVMEVGKKVHERVSRMAERFVTVEKRFETLGKGLKDLKSSFEGQQGLVKASNELKELGVDSGKTLPLELVDAPDRISLPDFADAPVQ